MKQSVEQSFSDTLDQLCAYYMTLGVPCDEYWNGDYTLLKFYVRKHKLALERRNEEMWWQGAYFYRAMVTAIDNCFTQHSKMKYPDKPVRITELTEEEKEEEQQKILADFRAQLTAACQRFEAKHKREQEQGGENLGSRALRVSYPANR